MGASKLRSGITAAAWAAILLSSALALASEARYEGAVLTDTKGGETNKETFSPDTRKIFLYVYVVDVPNGVKLTGTWIVEKAAGITPNSPIAASDIITRPQMKTATFSLDKPNGGWPPGDYRVELAIDGKLQFTARFKVVP